MKIIIKQADLRAKERKKRKDDLIYMGFLTGMLMWLLILFWRVLA